MMSTAGRRVRWPALGVALLSLWTHPHSPALGSSRQTPPNTAAPPGTPGQPAVAPTTRPSSQTAATRRWQVVHVFVALCDNAHQGIVPVSPALGNGQDPQANLYWGASYGVQTFFGRSPHWQPVELASATLPQHVLAQAAFRHTASDPDVLLFAQAYDGAYMKDALEQFLLAAAGRSSLTFEIQQDDQRVVVSAAGASDLVCFVGHNGLMDVQLEEPPEYTGGAQPRRAVVLACKSRQYFFDPLRRAGCEPLITTTGLMAPEAYVLDALVRSWARGGDSEYVRAAAVHAYAEYQKCSPTAANRLFATGW